MHLNLRKTKDNAFAENVAKKYQTRRTSAGSEDAATNMRIWGQYQTETRSLAVKFDYSFRQLLELVIMHGWNWSPIYWPQHSVSFFVNYGSASSQKGYSTRNSGKLCFFKSERLGLVLMSGNNRSIFSHAMSMNGIVFHPMLVCRCQLYILVWSGHTWALVYQVIISEQLPSSMILVVSGFLFIVSYLFNVD